MTLNLMIVNPHGIWQSSDHRLVDRREHGLMDDYSVKHVVLRCPDGVALIAYAGLGRLHHVDISDWLRETLRGEPRTVGESVRLVAANATQDFGPFCREQCMIHMFSVGAFVGGSPWVFQIRNFSCPSPRTKGPPTDTFIVDAGRISERGQAFVFGGADVTERDRNVLERAAHRKPRKPAQFRQLLAAVNRRVALSHQGKRIVSCHCVTSFAPPTGEVQGEFHDAVGARKPLVVPLLAFGIDTTSLQRHALDLLEATRKDIKPPAPDPALGHNAVTPRNRLRR